MTASPAVAPPPPAASPLAVCPSALATARECVEMAERLGREVPADSAGKFRNVELAELLRRAASCIRANEICRSC